MPFVMHRVVRSSRAFVLGLMASQRNMGLMLAATGGALPDFTWLYFALAQFNGAQRAHNCQMKEAAN
jgi:hypothetical protein